ncbi:MULTISPECIES: DUF6886 family protein [unclassified Lysinibacillus]|uniref:DUF6886 family protein n=1 Tax=unclassified Lysinibacillus TaxID=2636778 RepID=UPI00255526A3|nr:MULTISPECIES: DUF6886 family protein [unclassified Lysinibacillus]MDM5247211.1 hypothetical protein [Lysinibacillus sp. G4S2]
MRIVHVSEESDITVFYPRLPDRLDLDPEKGLVWAINETCLPNFLIPRNCPRVCYHIGADTTEQDKRAYIASTSCSHVIVIESKWFETMKNTNLYLYEFDSNGFTLQDQNAGYYTSETTQIPIAKIEVENLFEELFKRNVEVRIVDNLWDIHDEIQKTSFNWSMCRMRFAQPRK